MNFMILRLKTKEFKIMIVYNNGDIKPYTTNLREILNDYKK
jgi:hypothetical protein